MKEVSIEEKRYILDDFFKVEEAFLRFEQFDGEMSPRVRRLKLERGDSVAILVFNKTTQKVILIGQFRYPAYEYGQGWLIETIAGMVDPGESPEESARREIQEEIGLKIDAHVTVLMRQPGTRTPFNIQGYQMLEYDPENSKSLAESKQKLEIL